MISPKKTVRMPRSILFVPADKPGLADKAANSNADGVCLDLEDSVARNSKQTARDLLEQSAKIISAASKILLVRVNSELELFGADLSALPAECRFVVLPKTQGLEHIHLVGEALDRAARVGGCNAEIICLIEDVNGLSGLRSRGHPLHHRTRALALGTEDLATNLGCNPDAKIVEAAFYELGMIAQVLNLELLGFPGSIAEFRDLEKFKTGVQKGHDGGSTGALCIHPDQITILNNIFSPSNKQLQWATNVVAAFENAQENDDGVTAHKGQMIDTPVYQRALNILARDKKV